MTRLARLLCGALLVLAPISARAQESSLRGFFIGLDPAVYGMLSSEYVTGERTVGGFGFQLRAGWGFTEKLALSLDVAVTSLWVADTAEYLLGNGDILLRYTPFTFDVQGTRVVPYLVGGVGLRDITVEGPSPTGQRPYVLEGEVAAVGAGVYIFLTPRLSATLSYHGGFGDFTDERSGQVTTHNRGKSGESHRVAFGITLHPGRR